MVLGYITFDLEFYQTNRCEKCAVHLLGMNMVQLSKCLKISQPTVSQSANRGEKIAKKNKLKLLKSR